MSGDNKSQYREVKLLAEHDSGLKKLGKRTGKSRNILIREALDDFFCKYRIADGNKQLSTQQKEEPTCEDMAWHSQTTCQE